MTDKIKITEEEFDSMYEIDKEEKPESKEETNLTEEEQQYEDKYYENMNIDEEKEDGNK